MVPPVTVYWRPGCPYCRRLRGDLRRIGLRAREVNIWEDPGAAARVRAAADGNETVPTVTVGQRALVNPPASAVVDELRRTGNGVAQVLLAAAFGGALQRDFERGGEDHAGHGDLVGGGPFSVAVDEPRPDETIEYDVVAAAGVDGRGGGDRIEGNPFWCADSGR